MILEIDYGNTRLKWRLLDCVDMSCVARGAVAEPEQLLSGVTEYILVPLKFCRICSVRTSNDNNKLSSLVSQWFKLDAVYAVATEQLAGVVNGYTDVAKLGVDRWLAIVAAYTSINNACVVFDAGTALTVDYVSAAGIHLGGCIAPGLNMMTTALSINTQQLPAIAFKSTDLNLLCGKDTQSAISCGISAMLEGFVTQQLLRSELLLGADFSLICTGGDGALISAQLDTAVLDNDLVFKGLAIACPFVAGV